MGDATYDAIIIGAGHNGLILGLYLAYSGMEVALFERRNEFGGGLCTEESTLPAFFHNMHSQWHVAIDAMPAYEDFNLKDKGARYFFPEASCGMIFEDHRALVLYNRENINKSYREISRFSQRDADKYIVMQEILDRNRTEILKWIYNPPFPWDQKDPLQKLVENPKNMIDPLWALKSPSEVILELFESDEMRDFFHRLARDIGPPAERHGMGLAFVFTALNWHKNMRGCIGGSHNLAHAMQRALSEMGGKIFAQCEVDKIIIHNGEAKGIKLLDGSEVMAKKVIASNVDPNQTFLRFIGKQYLSPHIVNRVNNFRYESEVECFMAFALHEPPRYIAEEFNPDIGKAFFLCIGKGGYKGALRQQHEIGMGKIPETPGFTTFSNTHYDKTQAPDGKYTAGVDYDFPCASSLEEREWIELKRKFPERVLKEWGEFAPNMKEKNVIGVSVYTPYDISKKHIDMREGNWNMGDFTPAQFYRFRPFPECSNYITPIKNLYICGACTHPGGGILGACGYNAYKVIATDYGLRRIWEEKNREY
jgi:phytoene dehydrogenase-like protein